MTEMVTGFSLSLQSAVCNLPLIILQSAFHALSLYQVTPGPQSAFYTDQLLIRIFSGRISPYARDVVYFKHVWGTGGKRGISLIKRE